jgi:chitin disaccharide deacetylase
MQTQATDSAVRLIVHADDVGLCRTVNEATWAAMERGRVSSASIMAPCPAFAEAASYARSHPEMDWGAHLTLTAEWESCRWGPVAPRSAVCSLLADDGCFWPDAFSLARHGDVGEVELEIRAQIERLVEAGVTLSHLDSHMFALFRTPGLREVLSRVSGELAIPHLDLPGGMPVNSEPPVHGSPKLLSLGVIELAKNSGRHWVETLAGLLPGLYEVIVHCGYDNEEMRAIAGDRKMYGAHWRRREFDALMSDGFEEALRRSGVALGGWRQVSREPVRGTA